MANRCKYCGVSLEENIILAAMISLGVRTQDPSVCRASPDGKHDYKKNSVDKGQDDND